MRGKLGAADMRRLAAQMRDISEVDPNVCLVLVTTKQEAIRYHEDVFEKQARLHDPARADAGPFVALDVADPNFVVRTFRSCSTWIQCALGGLSAKDKAYVEDNCMPLWEQLRLRPGSRVVALGNQGAQGGKIKTGMTGTVAHFTQMTAIGLENLMYQQLRNLAAQRVTMTSADLRAMFSMVLPRAADRGGQPVYYVPFVLFSDPRNPNNTIGLTCVPEYADVWSKDEHLIVRRWALGLAGGWAVKFGQALGSTLEQVFIDLSCASAGAGPNAFVGLTRVKRLDNCFLAQNTPISCDTFLGTAEALEWYYSNRWHIVKVPRNNRPVNMQPLRFV